MTPISRRTFTARAYAPTVAAEARHTDHYALVTIDQPIKATVKVKEVPGTFETPTHPQWEQAVRDLAEECGIVGSGTVNFTTAYPHAGAPHLATSAALAAVQALSHALEHPLHPDKLVKSSAVPHPEILLGGYITGTPISSDTHRHHLVVAKPAQDSPHPSPAIQLNSPAPEQLRNLAQAAEETSLTADISQWLKADNFAGTVVGNDTVLLVLAPVDDVTTTSMSRIAVTLRSRLGEQWNVQMSKSAPPLTKSE